MGAAMAPVERRSAPERREEILAASLELFSRHGLHGVTTRMIADAAGVSEALLYRHFDSKERLYTELQQTCLRATRGAADRLAQMEPGTATLVLSVYFMTRQIMLGPDGTTRASCIKRLVLGSLVDDGAFARGLLDSNIRRYIPKLVECVEAARRAGDLVDRGQKAHLRVWFAHHLAVMTSNFLLPSPPAVDYGVDRDTLINEIARFSLRGLGLTEEALERTFVPRTLRVLVSQLVPDRPNG
jgi:AcrR family transcriptional regulator